MRNESRRERIRRAAATRKEKGFNNKMPPKTTTQEPGGGGCLTRSSEVAGDAGNPRGKPLMELPTKTFSSSSGSRRPLRSHSWGPERPSPSQRGPALLARQDTTRRKERDALGVLRRMPRFLGPQACYSISIMLGVAHEDVKRLGKHLVRHTSRAESQS
ncbi:hypothetical protein HPB50_025819 [Hyalomma asiaticum]|uniref:Uncharacterized protein n=1 Tax=Hyalomma asiaticum TaxID=266040 RepID=A0ACB7STP1_HYAAI|nr:hypothetical protein HPB50_025819 [Hyalomma asiaticum]